MGLRKALLAKLVAVRVVDGTRVLGDLVVEEVLKGVLGDLVVGEVLEGESVEVISSVSSIEETVAVPFPLAVKTCSLTVVTFVYVGETQKAQNDVLSVVFTSYRAPSLQSLSAFCQLPTGWLFLSSAFRITKLVLLLTGTITL